MAAALVTGANGVSGSYMVERILNGKEFARVVGSSRRVPNADWVKKDLKLPADLKGSNLTWATADLYEETVESLTKKFADAGCEGVTVLFWGAYVLPPGGWGTDAETEINKVMFDKCIQAVVVASKGSLKRVILQLGEKWYWGRDVTPALPQKEIPEPPAGTISAFYREQYLLAVKYGKAHGFDWTVTLPMGIYGWTRQSQQTLVTSIAVFIFAHSLLNKPLVWPGNTHGFNGYGQGSDARFLADLNLWASLEPKCAGEVLNAGSEDLYIWRYLWPRFGAYFGCEVPSEKEMSNLISQEKGKPTQLAVDRIPYEQIGPAFKACKESGIGKDDPEFDPELHKAALPWDFLQYLFNSNGEPMYQSMSKVRRLGFRTYMDSVGIIAQVVEGGDVASSLTFLGCGQQEEGFYDIFDRMVADGVFPKNLPGRDAARKAFKW